MVMFYFLATDIYCIIIEYNTIIHFQKLFCMYGIFHNFKTHKSNQQNNRDVQTNLGNNIKNRKLSQFSIAYWNGSRQETKESINE